MNSNPASKLMPEELPSKIHTGSLLGSLDEATQAEVLGLHYMKHPLVEATETYPRFIQKMLTKYGHLDINQGVFIRTVSIRGTSCGPMGCRNKAGYVCIRVSGSLFNRSQLVYLWFMGRLLKKGEQMDHIDGNQLNDYPGNLRLSSATFNQRNRKVNNNNTSGYTGVFWDIKSNKYRAYISVDYKSIYIGTYATAKEAYTARQNWVAAHPELGFTTRHGL